MANKLYYGLPGENVAKKRIAILENIQLDNRMVKTIDTLYTLSLLYNKHLANLNDAVSPPVEVSSMTQQHVDIAIGLIPKIVGDPSLKIDPNISWHTLLSIMVDAKLDKNGNLDAKTYYPELIRLYKKFSNLYPKLDDAKIGQQIQNLSQIITLKRYIWLSVSPFVKTEKTNEYHTRFKERDSLYIKPNFRWTYGGSVTLNFYWLKPNKLAIL